MCLRCMSGRLRTLHYIVGFIRFCVKRHQRANRGSSKSSHPCGKLAPPVVIKPSSRPERVFNTPFGPLPWVVAAYSTFHTTYRERGLNLFQVAPALLDHALGPFFSVPCEIPHRYGAGRTLRISHRRRKLTTCASRASQRGVVRLSKANTVTIGLHFCPERSCSSACS